VTHETIRSALDWGTARLRQTPSSTPRLDAELLLSHATDRTRTALLVWPDHTLTSDQSAEFSRLIEQRASGMPVAYLVGRRSFMELDLAVGPGALVPRPETELLVEWSRRLLSERSGGVVVDGGTGPGTIILALANHQPSSDFAFIGSDPSPDALAWARQNRASLNLDATVHLVQGDLLTWFGGKATLVTANLPYLRPDQIDGNWELANEPRLALDGGARGLELIERLVASMPPKLERQGALALEIDPSQSKPVVELLQRHLPWLNAEVHQDLAGLDRFVTASPIAENQR
jgi:release factor glutamine methyltransferase